ncbi:transglutaminase domain-containing protein [Methanobrevibacter sp.]
MILIVLMVFLAVGAVSATESINVSDTEDSNYLGDDVDSSSANNKLEISNEVSISQTNIVNSHDDNLGNCPNDGVLNASSDCGDGYQEQLTSKDVEAAGENALGSTSSSADVLAADGSSGNIVGAGSSSVVAASKVSTKLKAYDTHYSKSSTIFEVILKDTNGNHLANQKVILKVNKKSYSGVTNANGVASIRTDSLKVGLYTLALTYGGNSNHSPCSLSKKVMVLPSVAGSGMTTYSQSATYYKATFWKDCALLANSKVTFKLNGKTYTAKTDKNGVAGIKVSLYPGKYAVTVINPHSKEQVSYNIVVKKESTEFSAKKTYVPVNEKASFKVVLKSKHNVLLKNKKVYFTYNKKTVTAQTNEKGEAVITIPVLAKGTYKISFKYDGNDNYYSCGGSAELAVVNPTTVISSDALAMTYNDGSKFKVKLTDTDGNALANKDIKFKINGKATFCRTNNKGNAWFSLKNVLPGSYVAKYSYLNSESGDYNQGSNRIVISKVAAVVSAKDLTMKSTKPAEYSVKVKDSSGKLLKGVSVKTIIGNGKSYVYKSDSKGVAKVKISKGTGIYDIKTVVSDPIYKSAQVSKRLTVKGTKIIADDLFVMNGKKVSYHVLVVNEKNKPVKGKDVVFKFKGKYSTKKSNSNGNAWIDLFKLSKGTYKIKFYQDNNVGSAKIYVAKRVPIKSILYASKTVNKYISKYHKLPSSVEIDGISFKTSDYLYFASKAIISLNSGNKKDIPIKFVKNPSNPKGSNNLGYLKDYVGVAKNIVKTAESNGKMPNSVSSAVGSIGYNGLVYTFSDVLTHYRNHNELPSYVKVSSFTGSSSSYSGVLNTKNTIKNLLDYLVSTENCDVNNGKIKDLVYRLTKDCTSEKEKANVIFDYVIDTISYSFYYDTRYGAVGTLNAGTGNCVDHAHILVAMYRAAGLPARYVHGTCTFSSGSTYGHVWAQVLIGDTWVVADGTSNRNSLGYVANWNTGSYGLNGYYRSLPF